MLYDFAVADAVVLTHDMGLRSVAWHGSVVGLLTHWYRRLPESWGDASGRYVAQLGALQAVFVTDFAQTACGVRPPALDTGYPETEDLDPAQLVLGHDIHVDGLAVQAWSASLAGCRFSVGDPKIHPFVLLAPTTDDVTWPPLRTRAGRGARA